MRREPRGAVGTNREPTVWPKNKWEFTIAVDLYACGRAVWVCVTRVEVLSGAHAGFDIQAGPAPLQRTRRSLKAPADSLDKVQRPKHLA